MSFQVGDVVFMRYDLPSYSLVTGTKGVVLDVLPNSKMVSVRWLSPKQVLTMAEHHLDLEEPVGLGSLPTEDVEQS